MILSRAKRQCLMTIVLSSISIGNCFIILSRALNLLKEAEFNDYLSTVFRSNEGNGC